MDLQELVAALRRRWVSVVTLTVLGALAAWGFTALQQPTYTATATVLVSPSSGQTTGDLTNGAVFLDRVVQTYAQIVYTPIVLGPVADDLDVTVGELRSAVQTTISSGTTLVGITVTWDTPEEAATIANAVADQFSVAVDDIAPRYSGNSAVVVTTVTPAVPPSSPSSPNLLLNVVVGAVAGLLIGLGYVTLRETLGGRARRSAEVGSAGGA